MTVLTNRAGESWQITVRPKAPSPEIPTTKVCPRCCSVIPIQANRCPHGTSDMPPFRLTQRPSCELFLGAFPNFVVESIPSTMDS